MEYDGEAYHDSCFCCSTCNQAIGTKRFVKAEGDIICQACFESDLAKKCIKCNIVSHIVSETKKKLVPCFITWIKERLTKD